MRKALLLAATLLFSACSVYHPLRGGVGYTDTPVGPDTYQVSYAGPYDMPIAQARDFALLRAAELSVLAGAPFFEILNQQGFVNQGLDYVPGASFTYFGGYRHRGFIYGYDYPGYFQPYTIPEFTMTVRPTATPTAAALPAAYLIRRALADHIKLTPTVPERAANMPTYVPATQPATPQNYPPQNSTPPVFLPPSYIPPPPATAP